MENVSLSRFSKIKDLPWKMAKIESKSRFDAIYKDVGKELEEMKAPSSEVSYIHETMIGKEKRHSYYMFEMHGTAISKVQHSVLASYFKDSYCKPPLRFCSDLITLGKYKDVKYAEDLFRSKEKMKVLREKILATPDCHASLKTASAIVEARTLNSAGMHIFMEEFIAAMRDLTIKKTDSSSQAYDVIDSGRNGKTYHFKTQESKCPGPCRVSKTMSFGLCRHVIKNRLENDNLFDINQVDKRYHYKNSINHIPRNKEPNCDDSNEIGEYSSKEIKERLEAMRKAGREEDKNAVIHTTSAHSS